MMILLRPCRIRSVYLLPVGFVLLIHISLVSTLYAQNGDANDPSSDEVLRLADRIRQEQYRLGELVLNDYPDNFHAIRLMGYVHSSQGNLEEMFKCWQRCADLAPDRADVLDQMAKHAMQAERYKEAIEYWKKALAIDPNLPDAYQFIGECLLNYGRPVDARRSLELATKKNPESAESFHLLGEAWFQSQEFEKAKQSFEKTIALQKNHTNAYYGLIKTCARLGLSDEMAKYAQAFQQLEAAAYDLDQQNRREFDDLASMRQKLANTYFDAGRIYLEQRPEQAERMWRRATELDIAHISSREALAALYIKQRNAAKAIEQYEALAHVVPTNPAYFRQLGLFYVGMRDFSKAEQALQTLIKLNPQDPMGYRTLVQVYLNTDQKSDLALKLATRATQLQPNAESHFILGLALARNGKREQAIRTVQKAVELAPEKTSYQRFLKSLQEGRRADD